MPTATAPPARRCGWPTLAWQSSWPAANGGYVLENGRIALSGSGEELLNSPHVRRAYLGH
jgi:ABC-type branched-subunit amino acid transport system ATPase component